MGNKLKNLNFKMPTMKFAANKKSEIVKKGYNKKQKNTTGSAVCIQINLYYQDLSAACQKIPKFWMWDAAPEFLSVNSLQIRNIKLQELISPTGC